MTRRLMGDTARLAERYDCQLHTHLCETQDEERFCLDIYAVRPVDLLEETGWMSNSRLARPRHSFQRRGDRAAWAGRASGLVIARPRTWCSPPASAGPCELEAAGAPVGIGVDGSASNDSSNIMEAVAPRPDGRAVALRRLSR